MRLVKAGIEKDELALISEKRSISNIEELEDLLSAPTEATVEAMGALKGDIVVLGVGGKMGPTLSRMAKRASDLAGVKRRVIGVSRFSGESDLEKQLNSWGVETYRSDLLDGDAYKSLPDADNVVFMAGMKFGSTGQEAMTWGMNTFVPGLVAARYRHSRIAAFSTGNVYGLSPISLGGSVEGDPVNPTGEYAISCLGRERIFEHFSRMYKIDMTILRLNYATELRYGVLLDVAQQVFAGQPISLGMGNMNAIWQTDANAMSLRSLALASSPPNIINIAGPELLSVRRIATQFGELFQKPVSFEGEEAPDALLNNGQKALELFGYPQVGISTMVTWIADWVARGGGTLNKPTHFENRAGKF